jgi:hypothetical protein
MEFQSSRTRAAGLLHFGFTQNETLVSFVPNKKKAVFLVTSMHHKSVIEDSEY